LNSFVKQKYLLGKKKKKERRKKDVLSPLFEDFREAEIQHRTFAFSHNLLA